MIFPPSFNWGGILKRNEDESTAQIWYAYLYEIGRGQEWQPLFVVTAHSEDEALNKVRHQYTLKPGYMVKVEEREINPGEFEKKSHGI